MTKNEVMSSDNNSLAQVQRRFCVVLSGCSSAAVNARDGLLTASGGSNAIGTPVACIRTEHYEIEGGSKEPGALVIDVSIGAPQLDDAMQLAMIVGGNLAALMAVACNAGVDQPAVDRAYETTRNADRRPYFQDLTPRHDMRGRRIRFIALRSTQRFVARTMRSIHSERIIRASRHYQTALGHLARGGETLALAHLFMGCEAITSVVLDCELTRLGADEEVLARQWELRVDDPRYIRSELLREARPRLVFGSDRETHRLAKLASDGFEHGFKNWETVGALASKVVGATAQYLRGCIIRSATFPESEEELLCEPFSYPVHAGGNVLQISGVLVGRGSLAPEGQLHPGIACERLPGRAWRTGEGLNIEESGILRPRLGKGIHLEEVKVSGEAPKSDPKGTDVRPISVEVGKLPG